MAKKYAIVISDTGLKYGTNAVLNALKYYDHKNIELHLLHNKKMEEYVNNVRNNKKLSNILISVSLENFTKEFVESSSKSMPSQSQAFYAKFLRYVYPVRKLINYDAVCIFDGDQILTNNIQPYFEIAEKTNRILLTNNDRSGKCIESYSIDAIQGAASGLFQSVPTFFKPETYKEIFEKMPELGVKFGIGDMSSLNKSLIMNNKMNKENVFILNNIFWIGNYLRFFDFYEKKIANKRYCTLLNGERINSFHGKFWKPQMCDKRIHETKRPENLSRTISNVKLFWEFTEFFNTQCYHRISIKNNCKYFIKKKKK